MVSGVELRDYLDFAVQTAFEAGRLTLGYFQTGTMRPELKPDDTPVTAADREAEKLIRARIAANYPGEALSTTRELFPEVLQLIEGKQTRGAGSLPRPKPDT
jgi:3'-phosphoadenosine 5'-phosphosulfate (PAPS) 3'-phosphatase